MNAHAVANGPKNGHAHATANANAVAQCPRLTRNAPMYVSARFAGRKANMRKLRETTYDDLRLIERAIESLRWAKTDAVEASCPALAKKIASALKSADGALRHADRAMRYRK